MNLACADMFHMVVDMVFTSGHRTRLPMIADDCRYVFSKWSSAAVEAQLTLEMGSSVAKDVDGASAAMHRGAEDVASTRTSGGSAKSLQASIHPNSPSQYTRDV